MCRTETMRAYRISTKETYEANGVERVIWAASESSATCAACWAMDGRAFDLNKLPNDHPNGRCTILTPRKLFFVGTPKAIPPGVSGPPAENLTFSVGVKAARSGSKRGSPRRSRRRSWAPHAGSCGRKAS